MNKQIEEQGLNLLKKGAKRAVSCGFQPGRADGGIACAAVYDLVCRIRVV